MILAPTAGRADCYPRPPGLVAWWPGEGDGTDIAGAHAGELLNGADTAPAIVGSGLRFDGVDDCVRIPFTSDLALTNFSVEAWVKPMSQVSDVVNQELIFGQSIGQPQLVARPGTTGLRVAFLFKESVTSYPEVVSQSELPLNVFSHVAGTWDGVTLRLYVNGSLNSSAVPGKLPTPSNCPFFIGGFQDACGYTGQFFNGIVDELSLYTQALSPGEIQGIYAAGGDGKCLAPPECVSLPPAVAGWWAGEHSGDDWYGGHTAELAGGLAFAQGYVGSCFVFNGTDAHLRVPQFWGAEVTSLTIEGWIWPERTSVRAPICGFYPDSGTFGLHLWHSVAPDSSGTVVPGTLYANVRSTADADYVICTGAGAIPEASWSHFALTYDNASGVARLWVNGDLLASELFGGYTPKVSFPFYVGYCAIGEGIAGTRFTGKIDEFTLYERALTGAEVLAIYTAGRTGKCLPPYNDGIPIAWRVAYFGPDYADDPRAGTTEDPDEDGFTNLDEYLSDTNPVDANSRLATAIRLVPEIRWDSSTNRSYRVLRRDNLNLTVFSPLTPFLRATNSVSTFVDQNATSNAFYVIEVSK